MLEMYYDGLAEHYGFTLDTPIKDMPKEVVDAMLYGTKGEKLEMRGRPAPWQRAPTAPTLRALSTIWSAASGRPAASWMQGGDRQAA